MKTSWYDMRAVKKVTQPLVRQHAHLLLNPRHRSGVVGRSIARLNLITYEGYSKPQQPPPRVSMPTNALCFISSR
eukprot:CAMPEP_0174740028 /NCGR_PEP_ID=MMETSP1094-20130205/72606_1 /TAXON_ID=156173 /ORGANISM="Chrysochromulina brevifilum, Strain UTEX LB 985" /LENGTH=74 /DNA_ID=CAMNT_0015943663 /DNA_START=107 /DNA_END=331 /DNA_ORIENTATION=+